MAKKKTLREFGFPSDYEPATEGLLEAVTEEEIEVGEEAAAFSEVVNTAPVIRHEVVMAPSVQIKMAPYVATWDQIKNQLGSVSAMKSDLTGERITHGDAIAIFKTDAHRKLYEEWAAFKRAQV